MFLPLFVCCRRLLSFPHLQLRAWSHEIDFNFAVKGIRRSSITSRTTGSSSTAPGRLLAAERLERPGRLPAPSPLPKIFAPFFFGPWCFPPPSCPCFGIFLGCGGGSWGKFLFRVSLFGDSKTGGVFSPRLWRMLFYALDGNPVHPVPWVPGTVWVRASPLSSLPPALLLSGGGRRRQGQQQRWLAPPQISGSRASGYKSARGHRRRRASSSFSPLAYIITNNNIL